MRETGSIGYGLVGCGSIARFHVGGLLAAGARIVHVCDVDENAASAIRARTGARYSSDYHQLLADPAVTVVSVLTSTRWHRSVCLDALAAGKDVICEKTMSGGRSEATEIRAAAKASGRLFFTAFMKRFFPAAREAKELVPRLGRVFSAQVRAWQNWGDDFQSMTDASPFSRVLDNYGGAVLKCAGSHMLDMTMHLLGRPTSVLASMDYVGDSRFDRSASALLQFPGGATATFETAIHPLSRTGLERNGWEEWIEITGTRGRLRLSTVLWDHPENNGVVLEHYDEATGSAAEHRFAPVDPFALEMKAFHDALTRRERIAPNEDDGFAVDALIDAIERAAAAGRKVDLELPA